MDAVQDADLAGHPMHRKPHAMDIERDRARRQVGLALGLEAVADLGAGDVEVGQRDLLVAADHHSVIEAAVGGGHAGMAAGEVEDVVAQGLAVRFTALPATTVPVLANVPVSYGVRSVSALMMATLSARAPRTEAAICRCEVTDPLPISVEPTAR